MVSSTSVIRCTITIAYAEQAWLRLTRKKQNKKQHAVVVREVTHPVGEENAGWPSKFWRVIACRVGEPNGGNNCVTGSTYSHAYVLTAVRFVERYVLNREYESM